MMQGRDCTQGETALPTYQLLQILAWPLCKYDLTHSHAVVVLLVFDWSLSGSEIWKHDMLTDVVEYKC